MSCAFFQACTPLLPALAGATQLQLLLLVPLAGPEAKAAPSSSSSKPAAPHTQGTTASSTGSSARPFSTAAAATKPQQRPQQVPVAPPVQQQQQQQKQQRKQQRWRTRPEIQLLCLDMDGTLLDSSSKVLPSSVAAIRAALERGVTVCLATGKARPAAMKAMEAVGLAGAVVGTKWGLGNRGLLE